MPSIRTAVRQRILVDMLGGVGADKWKVLIVDDHTLELISAACKIHDVMDQRVTLVENITKKRQPLPQLEAVYFISPETASISRLMADFSDKKKPMYNSVHIFFSSRVDSSLVDTIVASYVYPRLKTLKELNVDFMAAESSVFNLAVPNDLYKLFSPEARGFQDEVLKISNQLVCLCATLNEYPFIRYNRTQKVSHDIAVRLQERLDLFAKNCGSFEPRSERATILILDRSTDPLSPLLHDFYYQAMAYDLLPISDSGKFSFTFANASGAMMKKETIVDENDALWPLLRHKHIADTIQWLTDAFNEFLETNKVSKVQQGSVSSLSDMADAIRSMPQYQEMLSKYSLHLSMTKECMTFFDSKKLDKVATEEQNLATGVDAEGNPVKNPLVPLTTCLSDAGISKEDKMRLIMIYMITQGGLNEEQRQRLCTVAGLGLAEQNTLRNLIYLGVNVSKNNATKKDPKAKKVKKKPNEVSYDLSRYVPAMKEILETFATNRLPVETFPFVREPPPDEFDPNEKLPMQSGPSGMPRVPVESRRPKSVRPDWARALRAEREGSGSSSSSSSAFRQEEIEVKGPRLIVFIAGGATASEMRLAYDTMRTTHREIILGSTNLLRPNNYVTAVSAFKKIEGSSSSSPVF